MSFKKLLFVVAAIALCGLMFAQVSYPFTIVDSYGREVTLEKQPQKVISLGPNVTEAIFAIGKGYTLVGRTDYCDYTERATSIETVGSLSEPVIEKIIDLEPDLVVGSTHVKMEVIEQLTKAGINVVALYVDSSFQGAYELILKLGKMLNSERAASRCVAGMIMKVSDVTAKVRNLEKPSVYYVVGFGDWGDYTAGNGTFISEMIAMAGGNNVANDMDGWKYNLEKLVEHDPDIVVCSQYWGAADGIRAANGYKDLTAVKDGKLFPIDNNMIDRQGPRLADGLEAFARIFHPEAFE